MAKFLHKKKKKRTEFFVNRKNEMAMGPVEQFKRHFGGTVNAIFIAAGGAKLGMASESSRGRKLRILWHCGSFQLSPALKTADMFFL